MQPLLVIEHLSKSFPGQVALDDVDLVIQAGRTHALVGQNGSGKSTLIKILAGYHHPTGDPTATIFDLTGDEGAPSGKPLVLGDGDAAAHAGITFVHQDLGLVDLLSTVENLALGTGFTTKLGRIDWKADTRRALGDLFVLGFDDFDVTAPVGTLAPSQKTAVALARALRNRDERASLLVLDEPTASLPGADVERLFDAIRRLKERGVAILYVSHHLDEVFAIADEVTVLRDGRRVGTYPVAELDHERLIELMIGHKMKRGVSTAQRSGDRVLLEARGVSGGNVARLDLTVHEGEVVGVAGITGSGREGIVPLLAGQTPTSGGHVLINGTDIPPFAPRRTLKAGATFLSADRGTQGVIPTMSVISNLTICDVGRNAKRGHLDHGKERKEAGVWIDRLRVKASAPQAPIATLSGGNQQKVLFARGLRLEPSVILLDEPTRGIDVGAKEEIHSIIDRAAAGGAAVLVVSTDTDELVRLASRIVVIRNGVIAAELSGDEITTENIERAQLQSRPSSTETATAETQPAETEPTKDDLR